MVRALGPLWGGIAARKQTQTPTPREPAAAMEPATAAAATGINRTTSSDSGEVADLSFFSEI